MGCIFLRMAKLRVKPKAEFYGFLRGYNMIITIVTGWWFGTMEFYDFPYIGNVIVPTDFHIFQRGRSTTNQVNIGWP
jgi:hypothetical protein